MNKSFLSGTRWRALGLSAWRALTHFVKHGGQRPVTRHLHRWSARFLRSLWYGTALVLAVVALLFSVARAWLLPALAERNQEIAEYVSEQSGYPVRIGNLESYWDGLNPGLRVLGVLPTMFDGRTNHARAVLADVSGRYGLDVLEPAIPKSIRFAEAPAAGRSVLATARRTPGAEAYRTLAAGIFS